MKTNRISGLAAFLAGVVWITGPAWGQVASSLINEGEEPDPINLPGQVITVINNVATNSTGGYASTINTGSISHIWGSADGISAPVLLQTEGTIGPLVQTSFESRFGLSDSGSVTYSASGTGGPDGGFDSAFLDSTPIAVEGEMITSGPLAGLFWSFASAPTMTANGIPLFSGGTRDTVGGATTARGLFNGTDIPVVFSGDMLPGLPEIVDFGNSIDFNYKFSRFGTEHIYDTFMETTGTGLPAANDTAMVLTGQGLFLDGQLVQEGFPVPVAIGGDGAENWALFDFKGVSDMGEYLFTGDTSAATTADEFVVLNGVIVLRENVAGIGGVTITGSIEAADMNSSGDWVIIAPTEPGGINSLIYNGTVVLREGDAVDFDGDGIVDPLNLLSDFEAFTNSLSIGDRNAAGDTYVMLQLDVDNGGTLFEGVYRMVFNEGPGPAGDLELKVNDAPDPLVFLPGDIIYTVKVRNNSGASIDNATVTTNLDPGTTFNAANSDPVAMHAAGVVTANLGTLAANEVRSYKFAATVTTAGMYTATSAVAGDTADTDPANNDATNVTEAGASTDLEVTLADSPDPQNDPNGTVTYTVDVTNGGPSNATGVVATITLDPTTVFNAGLSTPGLLHAAGVVTANVGAMPSGTSQQYTIVVDLTTQGTLTATAEVTGNQSDPDPLNNTFSEDTVFEVIADLEVIMSDTPDPVVPPGGQITYQVTARNNGPSPATAVDLSFTLDDSTSFVSVAPIGAHDGSPNGGVVSANLGDLASGAESTITVVVDTLAAGRLVAVGNASSTVTDPNGLNNNRPIFTLAADNAAGLSKGVFSNIMTDPTSDVPGLPGVKFDPVSVVDRPYRSPTTSQWVVSAIVDLATSQDEVIIIGNACSATLVAQEGVTLLPSGETVGLIDQQLSINDNGQVAFATNTTGATSSDEYIIRWDGTQFIEVAREGGFSVGANANYGEPLDSPNIIFDNTCWFRADTSLAAPDDFILSKNGNLQEVALGVSIPLGQAGGAMEAWQLFDTEDLSVDDTGFNYGLQGDLNGDTGSDDVYVVNDTVVIQEGHILAGSAFGSPVSIVTKAQMQSNADWFARAGNADGQDWVTRNGVVLSETDAPVHPGSPESFDDGPFSVCFFQFAANSAGDYLISGTTNAGEDRSNAVIVLNGSVAISREDDPIDLNGNGLFDDGVRIRTYGDDDLILTDDLQAYSTCTLRDFNDGGTNTEIGDAYIRFNLCGIATHCGDLDNDKDVDGADYDIFLTAFGKSACDADYRICADFDEDGVITLVDYQHWLLCYQDFINDPGASAPLIPNMGDFDRDDDVDLNDFADFQSCVAGQSSALHCNARFDFNQDGDVTAGDMSGFSPLLEGPVGSQ
jgi:uncharacterized repeat protein (TIGR01451 family)